MPPTLRLAKTLWGVDEASDPAQWDALFGRIKSEGFDGVEAITLVWRQDEPLFKKLLAKHGLALIAQIHTTGGDVDKTTGERDRLREESVSDFCDPFVPFKVHMD